MPHLCITVTLFIVITLLTTVALTDTKKKLNDSDTNAEIDNETIGEQQKNNSTTEQLIHQLVQQLQQIQQKILVIQKNLPKQQKQELSQRRVEAVQQQQQQQPTGVVKLNTARLNNNSTVDERKTNSSLKAQIKEFRHRFAQPREQFRKLVRAKDQPQPQIATSIDKTILKEAPTRVPTRQPLPVAKHETNKPSNQSQNFANQPPQYLPMAATEHSSPIRTSNQTQPTINIIDKETETSSNSSSIAVKCPKIEWQKIIEKAIKPDDPNTSITQLQAELANIERGIFVVMCSLVNQREQFSKNLKLKGDTYCQVVKDNVWCHAGGLSLKNGATFQIGR